MSALGKVTVASTKLVKAVSMVGMGAVGLMLAESALAIMVPGVGGVAAAELGRELLMFGTALAGWEVADWSGSKLQVSMTKAAQASELQRLQGAHALAR